MDHHAKFPENPEIHYHLHFRPYVVLDIPFDPQPMLEEGRALKKHFVSHRQAIHDKRYPGDWKSLALRAVNGDYRTTENSASDRSLYASTEMAEACPRTMAFLKNITDLSQCWRIRFMLLEPGARIPVHSDYELKLFPAGLAVNISLNMPEGCVFHADTASDGTLTKYSVQVPFSNSGSVMLFNNAPFHWLVNDSEEDRIHLIFHGPLRFPQDKILAAARQQNGAHTEREILKAITMKKVELSEFENPPQDLEQALLSQGNIVGMWPDRIKLMVVDTVLEENKPLRLECLHKITAASLFPLDFTVVSADNVDPVLHSWEDESITHVVMVGSGTYIREPDRFLLALYRMLSRLNRTQAMVAGHIIDTMTEYGNLPYLHEQFLVLDYNQWKELGKPYFAPLYSDHVGQFPPYLASVEQVHDDYTPLFLESDPGGAAREGKKWWGTSVLSAAIENNRPVINLPGYLRETKQFAYPNTGETEPLQVIRRSITQSLEFIHNWIYIINNEPGSIPCVPDFYPSRIISVAAGLKWLSIVKQYSQDETPPALILVDYSQAALAYVKTLAACRNRTEMVATMTSFSEKNPTHIMNRKQIEKHLDSFVDEVFSGNEDALFSLLGSLSDVEYCPCNFLLEQDRLLSLFSPAKPTIFWHSNAWQSHASLYKMLPSELEENYSDLLYGVKEIFKSSLFKRKGSRLAVLGNSVSDIEVLLTDGDPAAYSDQDDQWDILD